MSLTKSLILGITFLVSLGLVSAQESNKAFAVKGKKLADSELSKVEGGDTYVSFVKDKNCLQRPLYLLMTTVVLTTRQLRP